MTRQQAIEKWATYFVPAVFKAEDKLRPELKKILADHADDPTTAAELYRYRVAEEIVSWSSDEELAQYAN